MSDYTVYIKLPPYLRQWFIHDFGGSEPVTLTKKCIEWEILHVYLVRTPDNYTEPRHDKSFVAVRLPYFKDRDPRIYNHLTDGTHDILVSSLKSRFKIELWQDLFTLQNISMRIDLLLEEWMRQHGISCDDTNFQTVKQIYARMRKRNMEKNRRNEKKLSRQEKGKNNKTASMTFAADAANEDYEDED